MPVQGQCVATCPWNRCPVAVCVLWSSHEFEQFVDPFLEASAAQSTKAPKETQRFFSAKIFIEVRIFRQKTDGFPAFHETTVTSKNFRAATRWRNQPENYFESCAFAGTIRSEQPNTSPGSIRRLRSFTATIPRAGCKGTGNIFVRL